MNQLFVDNLTVMDFSYIDAERGLLGESLIVDVILSGELNEEGMLFDFGLVKKQIKQIIDLEVDHKLLVPKFIEGISIQSDDETLSFELHSHQGCQLSYQSPISSVLLIEDIEINHHNIRQYLENALREVLPDNVTHIEIHLRTELINSPFYHYSHGLKKHQGNCQRIAHGHRSKIHIWKNDQPAPELEQAWAERFRDIYIGTQEDVVINENQKTNWVDFAYTAPQGDYRLGLPSDRVYLIDTDSTVEWIATHIAEVLKQTDPTANYRVQAFEGVGKGAIACR